MSFNFNTPLAQQPASAFSAFGQPLSSSTPTSNFFGQSQQQQQQQPTQQNTGFQFGQGNSGTSSFFAQPTQQTGLTGIVQPQQQSNFSFAQPQQPQQQQQTQQPGAFSFSQPSTFGQTTLAGFGQPTQTNAFGQSTLGQGNAFGQQSTNVQPFGQLANTSGFGSLGTSTFGQSTPGTTSLFSQNTGTTFGQPTQTNAFGQPTQTSVFGQNTQPSAFGSLGQTNTFGQNAFGQPTQTSTFGQTGTLGTFGQPAQAQNTFGQLGQQSTAFGQPVQSAFGQPTQTNTFGQPAQSNTFGQLGQTSAFGQPAQTSAFGTSTLFGQPTSSAFGSTPGTGFGQIPPASTFGQTTQPLTFGQQPQTSAFGQLQTTSAFGQPAQNTSLFGQSTQPLGFGQPAQTNIFGTTSTAPSSFSFGQPTQAVQPQTATTFSLGQLPTSTPAFSFTTPASTAPATTFSFGQPAVSAPSAFTFSGASGFGAPRPATTFSFGQTGFGQPLQSQQTLQQPNLFGQPLQQQNLLFPQQQQQQPQQQQVDESHAFYQSIFQCNKFGDERDSILANFNYLQACWGTGKGHYSQTFPPITYTPANPFYRFKAVGYSFIYTNSNEDGHITFELKKSSEKVQAEETQFVNTLQALVNRPNILFKISGLKQLEEDLTVVNVFAEDKMTLRRIPATDLAGVFLQPHYKSQLENLGVINLSAKIKPSPEQLKRYIENPPEGLDPRVWRQANLDNPDPVNMIPVAIVGVEALKKRVVRQETESKQHMARLNLIGDDVATLQSRHTNVTSELQQMRRKQSQLSQRLLSVVIRQEMMRKQGMTLQVDEERLGKRLRAIHNRLNSPTEFKGRLSELLPQIRLHNFTSGITKYTIDDANLAQIKEFLSIEHKGMKELVDTVRADLDQLRLIGESMSKMRSSKLN